MKIKTGSKHRRPKTEIGWREIVALPDIHIPEIRAKIDTGARTSALHAVDQILIERNGERWVDFHVPLHGTPRSARCLSAIVDERMVKNTGGIPEKRIIIKTTLVLGKRHWHIEVSLADREKMQFDLILGRTAVRDHRMVVNPGSSYLTGRPILAANLAGSLGVNANE